MKKLAGLLAAFMLTSTIGMGISTIAYADEINVVVGQKLDFSQGSEPVIVNDRVMLPLRAVSEALGATVYWFGEDKRIQIILYDTLLSLGIDNNFMGCYKIVGGSAALDKTIEMDVAATIINDRTYVPVRAISEAFSADITWDNQSRSAIIIPKEVEKNYLTIREASIQDEGTLCAVRGVIGRDEDTGIYYIQSLGENAFGDYDRIPLCIPKKTSIADETEYGEYIRSYWAEQLKTEEPSGIVVDFTGVVQVPGETDEKYLVVNKTTTGITNLGYYDEYMKPMGFYVD